jgi:hypothetical protein
VYALTSNVFLTEAGEGNMGKGVKLLYGFDKLHYRKQNAD